MRDGGEIREVTMMFTLTMDPKRLEHLLSEIEKAAWARNWRELQAARTALLDATGIDISFQLRKDLETWDS